MRNGATENFLVAAIFSGVLTLVMMTGAMVYVIFTGMDNGTDISRTADSETAQDGFDPNTLPAPAAGSRAITYNCKEMTFHTSNSGINYVREYGGVYNAAIVNGRFSLYKLDYGHLQPVDNSVLDPDNIRKLRYALENCNETYIRSGAKFLAGVNPPGSSI